MFIVEINGGLGNQMSNYAFGNLLRHYYPQVEIKIYVGNYNVCDDHYGFEIKKVFKTADNDLPIVGNWEYFSHTGIIPYFSNVFKKKWPRYALNMVNRLCSLYTSCAKGIVIISEPFTGESEFLRSGIMNMDTKKNYLFRGLWLAYSYADIINDLRCAFSFKLSYDDVNFVFAEELKNTNSVAVHIRRGDYLTKQYSDMLNILTPNYYKSAVKFISERVSHAMFYVFSDDEEYSCSLFVNLPVSYKIVNYNKGENSYKDMFLISKCKHFILANSSFSYWGCLLGRQEDSFVITPKMHNKRIEMWDVPGFIKM